MPKVFVLKARGRHVCNIFDVFLDIFWPRKLAPRDGCLLLRKVFVPDATSFCTTKRMQHDLLFHCVFGNHRHNRCDGNAIFAGTC